MRRAHYLRSNAGGEIPSRIIFADTETKNEPISEDTVRARLWFGFAVYVRRLANGAYSRGRWFRFDKPVSFWRWALSQALPRTKLYIFTHNLGFDAQVLEAFGSLTNAGWILTRAIVDDPPTALTFRRKTSTVVLIDSLNIFRMPLAQLGKDIGYEKLEMPPPDASRRDWDTYCRRDVEVLRESILNYIRLLRDDDLGNFQITLAAQSLTAFRHRFMGTAVFIDDNEEACLLARQGYMGGRTEAFWYGPIPEPVHVYDINSQYPAVMRDEPMPTKLRSIWKRVSHDELADILSEGCAVADVLVETALPFLPKRWESRLVFPVGVFRTTLCSPELRTALARDSIHAIGSVGVYESAVLFQEFVDFFYQRRLEAKARSDAGRVLMYKLFMNSLYGKFGQSGRVFTEIGQAEDVAFTTWLEKDLETGEVYKVRQIASLLQRMDNEGESTNSSPAIAAHVTSAGRVLLQRYIERAGSENTYYCDTDSLMVNAAGRVRLEPFAHSDGLGLLKREHSVAEAAIWGAKDYVLDGVSTIKGVRKTARRIDDNTFEQDTFRGFKGMLRDGDHDRMLIKRTVKHLSRKYYKGHIEGVGRITPLRFNESAE